MVVEVRLRIRHRGCFTEMLRDGAHVTHLSSDRNEGISIVHASSEAMVDAILASMSSSLASNPVIERSRHAAIVRCQMRGDGVIATLQAFGCTILWPVMYSDGHESYHVIVASRDRLDALVDRLRELGDVRVEKVSDVAPEALNVSVSVSDLTSHLTERQLTILRRAIQEGYYDSPRRVTAESLAKAFGISRSTLEEHLRKAERSVLENFASVLSAHPALEGLARRRPGRPAGRPPAPKLVRERAATSV